MYCSPETFSSGPAGETPEVEIVYRRLPDNVKTFRQEILHDGPNCKFSLLILPEGSEPLNVGEVQLEPGGAILWYLFPDRSYEVGGVYDPGGRLLGWYTNLLRLPEISEGRWELTDLFLDVWQPPDGPARLLDEEDLAAALEAGAISREEARQVEAEAAAVLRSARAGRWPPTIVHRYPLEAVGLTSAPTGCARDLRRESRHQPTDRVRNVPVRRHIADITAVRRVHGCVQRARNGVDGVEER